MTAGIAAASAIRSSSLEGSLALTDEPFAHVLPNLSPRHVPRPRLTDLLDNARAQTLVLHAPAGYGKTSLAVEWLRERDDVAWFTAQPDSGDLGAAVLGVALAASHVVAGAADRVRPRLSIIEDPAQAARTFAEILAEDLADWPSGGVLAIDDYHHLAESDAAESFIDWLLVLRPSLRILVATRRRPSWASARRVLAGEIVELEKRVLPMTNDEVAAVLGDGDQSGLLEFVDKAEGWPAVIGLAALSPASDLDAAPRIADDLFRYFAEEVLRSMAPEEQRFVFVASVPRAASRELLELITNADPGPKLDELVALGLLAEAPGRTLRFHPLVRQFILREFRHQNEVELLQIARQLLDYAHETERWEDAFDAALMLEDSQRAADVAGDAAADLIRAGRIETVEKWLDVCSDAADMSASATLARATLLYYAGRFAAARTLALAAETIALTTGRGNPHRALILAARAAFASGHPKEALQLYMRVSEHAELESDRVDALSGAVLAASDMEDSLAVTLAEELDGQAPRNRINRIRAFTQWAGVGDRMGSLENAERLLNSLEPLEDADVDPVVHSSAYNAMVHVLCGQARFLEALEAASHGRALCKRFRLPWAGDWIDLTSVRGFLGLGRFGEARSSLARLASAAASAEDASFRIVYERSRLQLALSEPRSEQNYVEHTVASGDASPAFVAELTAFRAIEAALGRQATDAKRLATDSAALPGAVEPVCYSKLALALAHDLPRGLSAPSPQLQDAVLDAVDRRLVEAYLVVARCHRPLVEWGQSQPLLADALTRARILPVANGAGIRPANGPMATLTPREAEVLELIAHGRTNAEIASTLVVSLSTAKTHVHRIFTKLDARNRAEATRTFLAYRDYASEAQAAETSTSTRSG